ncbi:hypothetical protein [Paludisphaera sp.]|uniref:hypothetical protein n=1 Tax=Paludisphaera sp. TaxID=2017432 RepID=UPI00301BA3F5
MASTVDRNPLRNPSYPVRDHYGERHELEARLKACDEKLAAARRKFALLGSHPRRDEYQKLIFQLQGARDQFADAAYRMTREAGSIYHEDEERLGNAERAFAFVLRRWDSVAT